MNGPAITANKVNMVISYRIVMKLTVFARKINGIPCFDHPIEDSVSGRNGNADAFLLGFLDDLVSGRMDMGEREEIMDKVFLSRVPCVFGFCSDHDTHI